MFPSRKYVLEFVNLNEIDEERELRMRTMRLESGLSIPEQEIADMDGKQHPYSKIPVNAYLFQAWQSEHGQQPQPGQEPGQQPKEELGPENGGGDQKPVPDSEDEAGKQEAEGLQSFFGKSIRVEVDVDD
jgi:hypothetical protein